MARQNLLQSSCSKNLEPRPLLLPIRWRNSKQLLQGREQTERVRSGRPATQSPVRKPSTCQKPVASGSGAGGVLGG